MVAAKVARWEISQFSQVVNTKQVCDHSNGPIFPTPRPRRKLLKLSWPLSEITELNLIQSHKCIRNKVNGKQFLHLRFHHG